MPSFTNLNALYTAIQAKINIALENEVKAKVSEIMVEQIQETVYDAYSPNPNGNAEDFYHRRTNEDALGDPSNIGGIIINDGVLEVYNAATTNPDIYSRGELYKSQNEGEYLAPIIEYGQGYDYPNNEAGYGVPRPFVANTRAEIKATGAHVKALKQGLKKQGVNVE